MLYSFRLREIIDQYQNTYNFLLSAPSLEEAKKKAERYANSFFSDPYAEYEDGTWYFYDWEVSVTIEAVERTTRSRWVKERIDEAYITDRKIETAESDLQNEKECARIAADPSHISHCVK